MGLIQRLIQKREGVFFVPKRAFLNFPGPRRPCKGSSNRKSRVLKIKGFKNGDQGRIQGIFKVLPGFSLGARRQK